MNNPKVAIITPTTGAKYLNQNIKSVESQTYTNLTHIVVGITVIGFMVAFHIL